jgi:dGTPase
LEVAQIAESIAFCLNHKCTELEGQNINPRICATAALLHDIGHPPFGHNGEAALDAMMLQYGGFEGNAQTLRIVTQLEKKRHRPGISNALDRRAGLNLTRRTVASVLKYDRLIPKERENGSKVEKGFYFEDSQIVEEVKNAVLPEWRSASAAFKTIECSIMDIADDIAYSTYDLEDSLKAGFLTPTKILSSDDALLRSVAEEVSGKIGQKVEPREIVATFAEMFASRVDKPGGKAPPVHSDEDIQAIFEALLAVEQMEAISSSGQVRTEFTADLVGEFVEAISLEFNERFPVLSEIKVDPPVLKAIEILKTFTYQAIIASSRVKLAEYRGKEVVGGIFKALAEPKGHTLLPDDALSLFNATNGDRQKQMRVICDFIAGMTDRYAVEFYGRLHSDSPQTIFKDI